MASFKGHSQLLIAATALHSVRTDVLFAPQLMHSRQNCITFLRNFWTLAVCIIYCTYCKRPKSAVGMHNTVNLLQWDQKLHQQSCSSYMVVLSMQIIANRTLTFRGTIFNHKDRHSERDIMGLKSTRYTECGSLDESGAGNRNQS